MKYFIVIVSFLLFGFNQIEAASIDGKTIRNRPPRDCRNASYSCVLKIVDGYPFWCMKPARDRFKRAKRKIRVTTEVKCVKRFPIEFIEPVKKQGTQEE